MLALNSQMCATSVTLSCFHVHTAINILRCFGYPREQNFGLVLILSPTGSTEGCVYFPQSCRNTHLPHFLDCLLNTTLIPCLLVFFLSILHERVCDYSRVQSSVTGIVCMGDMNIHITWLTHVRTGPKKKNRPRVPGGPWGRKRHGHYIYTLAQIRPLHCTISSLALRRSATNILAATVYANAFPCICMVPPFFSLFKHLHLQLEIQ